MLDMQTLELAAKAKIEQIEKAMTELRRTLNHYEGAIEGIKILVSELKGSSDGQGQQPDTAAQPQQQPAEPVSQIRSRSRSKG